MNNETKSAPSPSERPVSLDYLISDLGKIMGIPGLIFDGQNKIVLQIDARQLTIEYRGEETGLLFSAPVGDLMPIGRDELLFELMVANFESFRNGLGLVSFDMEDAELVWTDRVTTAGLTVESLLTAIERAAQSIESWASSLPQDGEVEPESDTLEASSATTQDFIKV